LLIRRNGKGVPDANTMLKKRMAVCISRACKIFICQSFLFFISIH
jgi:hypothetical protein